MNNMELQTLTVEEFGNNMERIITDKDGGLHVGSVVGIGSIGIGVSECIYNVAKKLGIGIKELRLEALTEIDLMGICTGEDIVHNELFPNISRDGERGLLVLEGITSAPDNIRTMAYRLLVNRGIADYTVPDGWLVVALGNGPNDGGNYKGLERAVVGKCISFRIKPDLDTWKRWAIKNDVNQTVLAFVSYRPEYFYNIGKSKRARVSACPRTWTAVSSALNYLESKNEGKIADPQSVKEIVASGVGRDCAEEFTKFYEKKKDIISVKDILDGKASTDIDISDKDMIHATVQSLIEAISDELKTYKKESNIDTIKRVANICNWVAGIGNKSPKLAETMLRELDRNVSGFSELVLQDEEFNKYAQQFTDYAKSKYGEEYTN